MSYLTEGKGYIIAAYAIKCQWSCIIGEALEAKVVQNMYDNIDNESNIAYAYRKTNTNWAHDDIKTVLMGRHFVMIDIVLLDFDFSGSFTIQFYSVDSGIWLTLIYMLISLLF